jgi:ATP-dependent DNA helicase RecG
MAIRKSNSFSERRVYPYVNEDDLMLSELMPRIRQRAVNRLENHPWGEMTDSEIINSAGLYDKNVLTGEEGFNLAGILLFGREDLIQQATPGYVTDCLLRVDNKDRYDDRERVTCNLIQAFERCMDFIRKHTIDPFFLVDNLNVSVRDLLAKELVSNVLVHREYSSPMPGRIVIEKDRIIGENWNRTLRPGRIDPENYQPYPKNPLLSSFFVQIGYADLLGSGVRNLYKYSQIYSGKTPELVEGDVFRTVVPITRAIGFDNANEPDNAAYETVNEVDETVNEVENDVVKHVLNAIRENPSISYRGLANNLSISRATVYRSIKTLREKELIKRVGSDKSGYWQVFRDPV